MKIKEYAQCIRYSVLIILFLCVTGNGFAQGILERQQAKEKNKGFVGLGLTVNEIGLLGLGVELPVQENLWFYGMGGIGTWGYKLTGGIKYYPYNGGYKSAYCIGYSYATGLSDFDPRLDVVDSSGNVEEKDVLLDLYSVGTLNLIYSYNLKVGRKSKFVFSGGYAIRLKDDFYTNKTDDELTQESKNFINLMAPGGLILGVKFMIGY
ncbi:hypothetical protein E9993_17385 [Labilibacter sediminis]|nr:hypothetical protein E9993_17385 [Labilibacter sediminis]